MQTKTRDKTRARDVLSSLALTSMALLCAACGGLAPEEVGEASTEHDFFGSEVEPELGSEPERSREPASPPGTERLAARQTSVIWTRWTKGEAQRTLSPHSTHVCGLAMVRGQFGNDTNVRILKSGANWVMGGENAAANTLQMEAVCAPYSAFRTDAGRTVTAISGWGAVATANNSTKTVSMPGGTTPVLTGVWGHFEGHGERSRVTLVPQLQAKKGTQNSAQAAYATALSFGLAASELPHMADEDVSRSASWDSSIVGCDGPPGGLCDFGANIARLASSFCYLSSVSGDFNGADEWAQVYPRFADGTWRMWVRARSDQGVSARAECVELDQRRPVANPR